MSYVLIWLLGSLTVGLCIAAVVLIRDWWTLSRRGQRRRPVLDLRAEAPHELVSARERLAG